MKYFLSLMLLLSISSCSFINKPSEIPNNTPTTSNTIDSSGATSPSMSGVIQQAEDENKNTIPLTPHDAKITPKTKIEEPVMSATTTQVTDDKEVKEAMKDIDAIFADIAKEGK